MRWACVLLIAGFTTTGPEMTRLQEQEKASLWVNRSNENAHTVKLSETITVVMVVEGDSPLEAFLAEKAKSTDGWHLEATGKPKVTTLEDGKRQRWEMNFVAKPLQPGSHPLQMPSLQYTEKDGVEHEIQWQPVPMNITTPGVRHQRAIARGSRNCRQRSDCAAVVALVFGGRAFGGGSGVRCLAKVAQAGCGSVGQGGRHSTVGSVGSLAIGQRLASAGILPAAFAGIARIS